MTKEPPVSQKVGSGLTKSRSGLVNRCEWPRKHFKAGRRAAPTPAARPEEQASACKDAGRVSEDSETRPACVCEARPRLEDELELVADGSAAAVGADRVRLQEAARD